MLQGISGENVTKAMEANFFTSSVRYGFRKGETLALHWGDIDFKNKVFLQNSTQLVTFTFKSAWAERIPELELLFHSNRGAQYTSHRFQELLHSHTVIQSFSNSRKPHDNAMAESPFASLKKEALYRIPESLRI